jgi:hypothetical protein
MGIQDPWGSERTILQPHTRSDSRDGTPVTIVQAERHTNELHFRALKDLEHFQRYGDLPGLRSKTEVHGISTWGFAIAYCGETAWI